MAMKYLKERSTEISTISGIMFLLSLLGIKLAPEHVGVVPDVIAAATGLFAILVKQNK